MKGALGSDSGPDPVVGCCVGDGRPGAARVGLTLAQSRQPPGYDATRDTISALASYGAADRWVMTSALVGLGVCHVITATGLRPARLSGRMVLGGGGLATVMVAVFAQPAHGNSRAHTAAAAIALTALAIWPLFAARRGTVGATVDAPRLACGVRCPTGAGGVVRG